ncbi:GAF domain-containing protein [Aquimarina sp. M1]
MDEQSRLQDLKKYHIMDTPPEKELDELCEIASTICDTPISLITILNKDRQWFKSVKGLDTKETKKEDAFCFHALKNPEEILVVNDSLEDNRFQKNPLVTGHPNIRFYAGAPLKTPRGNVLGTLCIIDTIPRHISDNQKRALQLLADRVMDFLNARKLLISQAEKIEFNSERLKKLTDQIPCTIFQIEVSKDKKISVPFISNGVSKINTNFTVDFIKKNPELLYNAVHPEDIGAVKKSIKQSFKNCSDWNVECRIPTQQYIKWYRCSSKPEKKKDGSIIWYGLLQDITYQKEYEITLEQILFDISHVLRKPVTTLQGLTDSIHIENMTESLLKKYAIYIKIVSDELDEFTRKLNTTYANKRKLIPDNPRHN